MERHVIIPPMQRKTKPIDLKEIKKIELIEPEKQFEKFNDLVHKVVNVPRAEILRREAAEKKVKEKKS